MKSPRAALVVTNLAMVGMVGILTAAGCGSSAGGDSSSGIPRTTTFATLTAAQDGTLCDWVNGRQGGYGRSVTCAGNDSQTTDASKADCVSAAAGLGSLCPRLSIASIEDCANSTGTDLCAFLTDPMCAPVRNCASDQGGDAGTD